jgi:hypothetical protein
MKIRVFGFEPNIDKLPDAIPPTSGFEWLVRNSGKPLSKTLTAAATKTGGFYAGVLLKARDSVSFTKMVKEGGISKLRAEKLQEGEQLAEVNFFIAHGKTGRGLYAHHHRSASLTSDFGWVVARAFRTEAKSILQALLKQDGLTEKEKKKLRQSHHGRFWLAQLLNEGTLKQFLKGLKRVSSFEAAFTSFDLEEDVFDPLSKKAKRKLVKFQFPPDVTLADLDDDIEEAAESKELDDFWVDGVDRKNRAAEFHKKKNVEIFGEYDYDDLLGDLELSFDDWPRSITGAEAVKKLLAIAAGRGVSGILSH